MRFNKVVWVLMGVLVLALALLAACKTKQEGVPAAQPAPGDGEKLVQERCTVCHGLERISGTQKTREGWEQTVNRMVGKGAELDESEKAAVIEYLAGKYGQ